MDVSTTAYTQPPLAENDTHDNHGSSVNNNRNGDHIPAAAPISSPQSTAQTSLTAPDSAAQPPRKRNKPSLSCETCTVKKTKCDRTRPMCFACVKRRSECHYSDLANLIEQSHRSSDAQKSRRKSKPDAISTPTSAVASVGARLLPLDFFW